jgi:hypothetical protein
MKTSTGNIARRRLQSLYGTPAHDRFDPGQIGQNYFLPKYE